MPSQRLFIINNLSSHRQFLFELFRDQGRKALCFNSAESFLYNADYMQSGCIILENRLPGIDGIMLQAELNQKQSPLSLIFYTNNISAADAIKAVKAGAEILFKPKTAQELLLAVNEAEGFSKQKAIELDIRRCLDSLTRKESLVLQELIKGHTNQQIAELRQISIRTVEVHRASIMKKFNASNAVTLVAKLAKVIAI